MAIYLKKKNKCRIKPFDWLNSAEMKRMVEEQKKADDLIELDDNYYELGLILTSKYKFVKAKCLR